MIDIYSEAHTSLTMRTGPCRGTWMFLLGLMGVVLLSQSAADSYVPYVGLPCCRSSSLRRVLKVRECYEQKPRRGCDHHAFLLVGRKGQQWCVDPNAAWLKARKQKGEISCHPDLSFTNSLKKIPAA